MILIKQQGLQKSERILQTHAGIKPHKSLKIGPCFTAIHPKEAKLFTLTY